MNKDFDNNIPILTKKKESLKVILVLFLICLAFLGLEIYYESLSGFIAMTAIFASILLVWLTISAINLYSIINIEIIQKFQMNFKLVLLNIYLC